MAEFAAGGLSLDQVETVVTRAPAWADARMAGFAGGLTVHQLQRVIRDEFFDGPGGPVPAPQPAATEPEPAPEPARTAPAPTAPLPSDRFSFGWTELGRFAGSFDVGPEYGAVLEAAFDKVDHDLFDVTGTAPAGSDVLLETVARAAGNPVKASLLEQWGNGSRPGDTLGRFRTFLHLELTHDAQHLLAELSDGIPLPAAILGYLTCDGDITPVWQRDHTPVGYGRAQRVVPAPLRRMVQRRDWGCRVPGCGTKHVEIHHITHWKDGGCTETWNLISLCARHHHLLHHGRLIIRGNPDQPATLEIVDASGRPIRGPDFVRPDTSPEPVTAYQPPSGERMNLRWFAGWVHPDVAAERARTSREHRRRMRESGEEALLNRAAIEFGRTW